MVWLSISILFWLETMKDSKMSPKTLSVEDHSLGSTVGITGAPRTPAVPSDGWETMTGHVVDQGDDARFREIQLWLGSDMPRNMTPEQYQLVHESAEEGSPEVIAMIQADTSKLSVTPIANFGYFPSRCTTSKSPGGDHRVPGSRATAFCLQQNRLGLKPQSKLEWRQERISMKEWNNESSRSHGTIFEIIHDYPPLSQGQLSPWIFWVYSAFTHKPSQTRLIVVVSNIWTDTIIWALQQKYFDAVVLPIRRFSWPEVCQCLSPWRPVEGIASKAGNQQPA